VIWRKKHGLKSVFIYPQETLQSYIGIAAEAALSIREGAEKSQQMASVINNSNQGIILTDSNGCILLCNPVIETFLGSPSQNIIGQRISTIFPRYKLKDHIPENQSNHNELIKLNGKQYVIHTVPIMAMNKLNNMLLFVDDIHAIQQTEYYIREALSRKGFVAKHSFKQYHSLNPAFQKTLLIAQRFAGCDEHIVISGETGTGKEVLAQSVHNHSARSKWAFVAINCSAVNENLLESELFGYDEGAFTGARRGGKKGLFELAHKGTIFLDEISEMMPILQVKLLRAIQEKEFMRVGGAEIIHFDARIIAATNKNLWKLVQENKFREDLYYRINVLEINLPSLRERPEDILVLFKEFLSASNPELLKNILLYETDLEQLLNSYKWPGNIRELENFTKMLSIATDTDDDSPEGIYQLITSSLSEKKLRLSSAGGVESRRKAPANMTAVENFSLDRKTAAVEALAKSKGNHSVAAAILGISRVTLWRWLKQS
jgi:propionate catabolism operon transcriptional regulator